MIKFVRILLMWLCCGAATFASIPRDAAQNLAARTNNALIQNFTVDAFDELTNASRTGTLTVSGATPAPATNVSVNGTSAKRYGDLTKRARFPSFIALAP